MKNPRKTMAITKDKLVSMFFEAMSALDDYSKEFENKAKAVCRLAQSGKDPFLSKEWWWLREHLPPDVHDEIKKELNNAIEELKKLNAEPKASNVSDCMRIGRTARGATNASVKAVFDPYSPEHAREAAEKWQDRLILNMRQLIMLNVNISNRILEMTNKFQNSKEDPLALPQYTVIYRREVKRTINKLAQNARRYRDRVLLGIDKDWRDSYETSQSAFDKKLSKHLVTAFYSLKNDLWKDKIELTDPLVEIYYCQTLVELSTVNTEWRKKELHSLDPVFDTTFRWEVFDSIDEVRKTSKMLMNLLTPKGRKDGDFPTYPEKMSYQFAGKAPTTKAAMEAVLTHANDRDDIVECLLPEQLEENKKMLEDMENWFAERKIPLSMEAADEWKLTSDMSMEARAVRSFLEYFEQRKQEAASKHDIFDAVAAWKELTEEVEAEWARKEQHNRDIEAKSMEASRRLHEDWSEERLQQVAKADRESSAAIVTEPRIEVLRQRLLAVAPKEVRKALKVKKPRKKTSE